MKYVIQICNGVQDGYYVHDGVFVSKHLHNAKIFDTQAVADKYAYNFHSRSRYDVVEVSDKELFKAKLTRT